MQEFQLRGDNLGYWRGDRPIFSQISFSVVAGEALHIKGPNGAGKTTLLRVLAGLASPGEGAVTWCGTAISECWEDYCRSLGFLGHATAIKGNLTVRENLLSFPGIQAGYSRKRDLDGLLSIAKLLDVRDSLAISLSAGQRQRASLARIIWQGAPLWILDEPVSSLDIAGIEWLEEAVRCHLAGGGAIVFTSHQTLRVGNAVRHLELI